MTFNQITRHGQSLIEVLVAVAVGAILVGGSAALIAVILQSGTQNKYFQTASLLAQELMDKAAVLAERDWYCSLNCAVIEGGTTYTFGLYNITQKGTAIRYRVGATTASVFGWINGAETVTFDNVGYQRYFYVQNICRSNSGIGGITGATDSGPGGRGSAKSCNSTADGTDTEDPSTQKVTVVVSWTDTSGNTRDVRLERYLTRSRNLITRQTDWSGGAVDPPEVVSATADTKKFNTATNIDNTTPGVIKIQGF